MFQDVGEEDLQDNILDEDAFPVDVDDEVGDVFGAPKDTLGGVSENLIRDEDTENTLEEEDDEEDPLFDAFDDRDTI